MKKILIVSLIYCSTLTGCDDELCYNCTQSSSGNTSNFCLPRQDGKEKKENLEKAGYSCKKQ